MSKEEGASANQSKIGNQLLKPPKISDDGNINNELFKNLEILDNENNQLKAILTELQEDLKEKDNSIEESHKIITKLKDQYSKVIKECQNLERINNQLNEENEVNKKEVEAARKSNELINKLKEKNEELMDETNRLRRDNALMKSKIINNNNITTKKEQDIKDKELIINDLKERGDNWVSMIKEREQIINEQSLKIKELSDIISRKDEQLKVMVNFSKEINKENKSNVQELTKQAVKTIKVFYNTLNNSPNNNFDSGYKIEFKDEPISFENFENILKRGKASFFLEDGLQGMMYIPPGIKSISKEFLMDMNFKTELIKGELFTGLIREIHFINFLEQIFDKLNINDAESIKNICRKVIEMKTNYDNLIKENGMIKKVNHILKQQLMENNLYIKKMKENMDSNLKNLKEKFLLITMNIESKVKNVKNTNMILKEKAKKDNQKLKNEISVLKSEILKLKKDNLNLKRSLNHQKENEKYMKTFEKELEKSNNDKNNNKKNEAKDWNNSNQVENSNNFGYIGIEKKINENINENNLNNNGFDEQNKNPNNINEEANNKINKDNVEYIETNNNNINRNLNQDFFNNNNNNEGQNNLDNNLNMNKNLLNDNKNNNNHEPITKYNLTEQNAYNSPKNNDNKIIYDNTYDNKQQVYNDDNINNNIIYDKENINYNFNDNTNLTSRNNKIMNNEKINKLQNLLNEEQNKNNKLISKLNSLKSYSDELKKNITILKQNQTQNQEKKNIFTPHLFIKLFFKINHKIFSTSEYKKYTKIYNLHGIQAVYDMFKKTCEILKRQVYETHFEIDTTNTNTDLEENLYNNSRRALANSSYRAVNEKILKLKKFEFDIINLNEFVKNYLVAQEIIIHTIFNNKSNVIQFDVIENLFKLLEECLNFKIDEMSDNVIFLRKFIIKFLKNQKNCLGLSLEYLSSFT